MSKEATQQPERFRPESDPAGRFRARFQWRVLEHLSTLSAARALDFILAHELFSLAEHPDLPSGCRALLSPRLDQLLVSAYQRIWQFQDIADTLTDIPLCPLKGIALIDTLYRGQPQVRAMADIDLLVPGHHLDEAVERLSGALSLRETSMSAHLRGQSHHRLLCGEHLKVELHSRLWLQYGHGASWDRLAPQPARVLERDVFALDQATTLCLLLVHFVLHGPFVCLKWVEDLARLADRYDGRGAPERAEALSVSLPASAGLAMLRRVLGAEAFQAMGVPLGIRKRARRELNERIVWSYLSRRPLLRGHGTGKLRRNLSALLLAPDLRGVLRLVEHKASELVKRWRDREYYEDAGRLVASTRPRSNPTSGLES